MEILWNIDHFGGELTSLIFSVPTNEYRVVLHLFVSSLSCLSSIVYFCVEVLHIFDLIYFYCIILL